MTLYQVPSVVAASGAAPARANPRDEPELQSSDIQESELKVVKIEQVSTFLLCQPVKFRVSEYRGTPTNADKARLEWLIRNKDSKEPIAIDKSDFIRQQGDEIIIDCVPFEWRGLTFEIAAEFDGRPEQSMLEAKPAAASVLEWIATIQRAEQAYPDWSGVEMTNAMRRIASYDSSKFRKMYGGSPRGRELKAKDPLTSADISKLEGWTKHSNVATGIVVDCDGDVLAAGHVLTGISAGVYRDLEADVTPSYSGPAGEKMDNLYAVTISGDLGQAAVLVNAGKDNKPYIGSHGDADDAEIIGDIDGFNLGFVEPKGGSGRKLSEILLAYYCDCNKQASNYRRRMTTFVEREGGKLKDQVRRFASTYKYGAQGVIGMFAETQTEADEATAEFWVWVQERLAIERERLEGP